MDDKLKDIFSNINDWLKYAEGKSATLIAGNGALIFGMSRIYLSNDIDACLASYLMFCSLLCLFSLSICLLSVVPALEMPWDSKPNEKHSNDNVLYFGDIAKYSPLEFLKKLSSKLGNRNEEFTEYQRDLAFQIITNSVIANKKYNHFKIAIWLTLAAVTSPIVAVLIYFFRSK